MNPSCRCYHLAPELIAAGQRCSACTVARPGVLRECSIDETATSVPNHPTPEGRALGRELARLCDAAEVVQRQHFPNHPERYRSCAFRLGTIPNGCPETLMDAVKCVIEGHEFQCHVRTEDDGSKSPCAGWMLMVNEKPRGTAPWPFSHEPGAAERIAEIVESGRVTL